MSNDLSKLCADFLRSNYHSNQTGKLKASHSRELVAAFFGYKSHAALTLEKKYPLSALEKAAILIPDIPLIEQRRQCLKELPEDIPATNNLASMLADFLRNEGYFGGNIWLYDTLETYIMEVMLIENDSIIMDELSGVMAETNTEYDDFPYYENAKIKDTQGSLDITVSGQLQGTPLDDKPFCGDTIDIVARVYLHRIAGKRGFMDFDIEARGSVNDEWIDPELKYDIPNVRPKEQFLEMTGGFRLGETTDQFQHRQLEIHTIRNRIADGKAKPRDVDRLSFLLGEEHEKF